VSTRYATTAVCICYQHHLVISRPTKINCFKDSKRCIFICCPLKLKKKKLGVQDSP
jgi:hypothetical protein